MDYQKIELTDRLLAGALGWVCLIWAFRFGYGVGWRFDFYLAASGIAALIFAYTFISTTSKHEGAIYFAGIVGAVDLLILSSVYKVFPSFRPDQWWLILLVLTLIGIAIFGERVLRIVSHLPKLERRKPAERPDLSKMKQGRVYAVLTQARRPSIVFPEKTLLGHGLFLGTPGSGKTSGFMLHMFSEVISRGAGCFSWDAKGNLSSKFEPIIDRHRRHEDYWHLDLDNPKSIQINPLFGRDPEVVSEIALAGLFPERDTVGAHSFYSDTHAAFLKNVTRLLLRLEETVIYKDFWDFTLKLDQLKVQAQKFNHEPFGQQLLDMLGRKEIRKQLEGLSNKFDPFVTPGYANLVNSRKPDITVSDILQKNQILTASVYSGKYKSGYISMSLMLMYAIETEMANRFVMDGAKESPYPFFVFLDEAATLLGRYPDFGGLLNKSREANIGIFYGLQTLADLEMISKQHLEQFLANTKIKCWFLPNSQQAADHLSKLIGTETKHSRVYSFSTDEGEREAGYTLKRENEFIVKPDDLRNLKTREAFLFVPYVDTEALLDRVQYPVPETYGAGHQLTFKRQHSEQGDSAATAAPVESGQEPEAKADLSASYRLKQPKTIRQRLVIKSQDSDSKSEL
jgi:hypothetical protein